MGNKNATPETHDPIARVAALLEKPKKQNVTLRYIEMLHMKITAGRAVLNTHAKLSK